MEYVLPIPDNVDDAVVSLWWSTDLAGKHVVKEAKSGKSIYLNPGYVPLKLPF